MDQLGRTTALDEIDVEQLQELWTLVNDLDVCCYIKKADGRYTFVNRAMCSVFDTTPSDLLGAPADRFVDLARSSQMARNDQMVLQRGEKVHGEEEVFLANGKHRVFWSVKLPLYGADGKIRGLCGISSDITEQRRAIDQLVERNELLHTILSNVDASIYLKDASGKYLYANQRVVELFNRTLPEIIGRTDQELLPPDVAARLNKVDRSVLANSSRAAQEETLVDAQGKTHHFWTVKMPLQMRGQPECLIGFSTDISDLHGLRQIIASQRNTDSLTGLPNRVMFESCLDELLTASVPQTRLAVVLIDLDHFKYINSSLGQQVGDQLIRAVAARLQQCNVEISKLARISGDEFAFILREESDSENITAAVDQIRTLLSLPYPLSQRPLQMTVSAGISLFPDDAQTGVELLSHAEAAMYSAKDNGRDQYRFYSKTLGKIVMERLELERDLRSAMSANDFELHYQPKIRRDNTVAGFEALIRWNRRGGGLIPPAKFIPLAEQLGLLPKIGSWVIEQACRQIEAWRDAGIGDVPIAVNLSAGQLINPTLPDHVFQSMREHKIESGYLEMEVTESMMIGDPQMAISMLHRLRSQGVPLSIDDFGTGFSSMAYLRQLPVNTLKLDRSFVTNVADDSKDADLCAGIIALAHKLDMDVVAEGVETRAQRASLVACHCDLFQGYLFSRPLPADQATSYLLHHRS